MDVISLERVSLVTDGVFVEDEDGESRAIGTGATLDGDLFRRNGLLLDFEEGKYSLLCIIASRDDLKLAMNVRCSALLTGEE